MIIFARKNYLPYIKTDMKKSILWVAAGMMTLAACQKQAGYTIQGLSLIHISEPTRPY